MTAAEITPRTRVLSRSALLAILISCATCALSGAQTPAAASPAPPIKHAAVHFEAGMLTVTASNASLNSILREVARTTGMKISGSVPEDRVFGTYGPADPQRVLATLLDGTGTNILIVSNTSDKPTELVLTRRTGGVTPPNPNANADGASDEDADDSAPPRSLPSSNQGAPPIRTVGQRAPQPNIPASATTQPSQVEQPVVFAPISPTTAPATGTTTPVNPDDGNDAGTESVKTPQQIFEQLQKLQQGNGADANTGDTPQQPNR